MSLKVAYIPEHFSTPLFLAEKHEFYKEANLSIEFIPVPEGSGRLIKLLNSKEVDLAIGLTEAFIADISKGNNQLKILDTYVNSPLLWSISTGFNRDEISNTEDLKKFGKVGISRIGSGSYVMSFVLAHQLGFQKFEEFKICSNFKNLRNSVNHSGSDDIENSDFFMWEYFTSKKYYDNNEIKKIGEIYTPWPSWVIVGSSTSIETKSKEISNFIKAVNKGINYFNNHLDEAIEYIGNNLDYSIEDAKNWTKTVEFNSEIGEKPLDWDKIVTKTTNVLKDAGVLKDEDDKIINERLESNVYKTNI
ncbi:uncharacterized protein KGF55_003759 [Candida pseudojiufengensis]|uniref:uncharacterized protein n=1 Tax=Candida pseudojiufengensis TaxID=497109 RepID=UPI00222444AA|nr:uncharacterized protein KGF55_003759 [Candida pseudojiufengensis]KAI5962683.1 hypothetical protein KGF55_003759 [Candida pseudojiufengensis]